MVGRTSDGELMHVGNRRFCDDLLEYNHTRAAPRQAASKDSGRAETHRMFFFYYCCSLLRPRKGRRCYAVNISRAGARYIVYDGRGSTNEGTARKHDCRFLTSAADVSREQSKRRRGMPLSRRGPQTCPTREARVATATQKLGQYRATRTKRKKHY